MTRKTRRLIMSAWLIFAAVLLTALVSGGFCYAGFAQGDPILWVLGIVSGIIINAAGVAVLNDYWRAG